MATRKWLGGSYTIAFTNGTHEPIVGEELTGATSGATAKLIAVDLTGAWDGSGTGTLYLADPSGAFQAEEIRDGDTNDVCDIGADLTNKTGDWQTKSNWSGDTVPVATDYVFFDGRGNTYDDTIYSVTDGIAVGETGGITFASLIESAGYTGDIGTTGERLHTDCDLIFLQGTGTCWIEVSEDATGKDVAIASLIIANKETTVHLSSNENTTSWCCEFTQVIVTGGTVIIEDDTPIESLILSPTYGYSNDVTVTVGTGCQKLKTAATYSMDIEINEGTLTTDSHIDVFKLQGGTVNFGSELDTQESTIDITVLYMHSGALNWYPDSSSASSIINGYIFGGTLDASGTKNKRTNKNLGTSGNSIFIFEGAIVKINNGMGNIDATTSSVYNFGGTFIFDSGAQVDVIYTS